MLIIYLDNKCDCSFYAGKYGNKCESCKYMSVLFLCSRVVGYRSLWRFKIKIKSKYKRHLVKAFSGNGDSNL